MTPTLDDAPANTAVRASPATRCRVSCSSSTRCRACPTASPTTGPPRTYAPNVTAVTERSRLTVRIVRAVAQAPRRGDPIGVCCDESPPSARRFAMLRVSLLAFASRSRSARRRARAGRGHDPDAGDGAEPADRGAARGLVLAAPRRDQPPIPAFGGHPRTTSQRSRRSSSTRAEAEGVRGDIAFVQSMLETGWLGFTGSQIPPDAYNYAGIYAFDGRTGAAELRARRLARRAAAWVRRSTACSCRSSCCAATPIPSTKTLPEPVDLRAVRPRRARADLGVLRRAQLPVRQADLGVGRRLRHPHHPAVLASARRQRQGGRVRAVRAARQPVRQSGNGYWDVTERRASCTRSAARTFYGDPRATHALERAARSAASRSRRGTGYWLLGRDGGIFTYGGAKFYGSTGGMHLNKPVNGMERTDGNSGYWLVADDGGIFSFGNAQVLRLDGRQAPQPAGARHGTHHVRQRLLAVRERRRHLHVRRRAVLRLARRPAPQSSRSWRCSARRPGKGYWMLTADGRMFAFGDAKHYGDIAGCTNYGGATRLLVAPDGKGYWIATGNGSDRVRRREAARLPGHGGRAHHRLARRELRTSPTRQRGAPAYTRSTTHGELGGTGLRGWLAAAERRARHRPLEPAPGNAGGGRDMRERSAWSIVLAGGDPVEPSASGTLLPDDRVVVAADSGVHLARDARACASTSSSATLDSADPDAVEAARRRRRDASNGIRREGRDRSRARARAAAAARCRRESSSSAAAGGRLDHFLAQHRAADGRRASPTAHRGRCSTVRTSRVLHGGTPPVVIDAAPGSLVTLCPRPATRRRHDQRPAVPAPRRRRCAPAPVAA